MNDMNSTSRTQMRRHDRKTKLEARNRDFLVKAEFGVVGTCDGDQPFLTNLLFYYDSDQHLIYLHTAKQGRLVSNLRKNPRVCFSVASLGRYLPADIALEFSVEYQSVVLFGSASIVEDGIEAKRALQKTLDKYFPHLQSGKDYRPTTDKELQRTAVIRIRIEEWSGKEKREAEDFPHAFRQSPKVGSWGSED